MAEKYDRKSERGHFGIGIYQPKFASNVGVLWRSAFSLGANYIFTIGTRYKLQRTDIVKAYKHIPLFEYDSFEDLSIKNTKLVGIEITDEATPVYDFIHPERAIYLLGSEDQGLNKDILGACNSVITIPSVHCLNVSTVGSIIMYDRLLKENNGN